MGNEKDFSRRDFLKKVGTGAVLTGATLTGCKLRNGVSATGGSLGEVPSDKMTYRTNSRTGDVLSLLGYGCMRWPTKRGPEGRDIIDQDAVNELVDYAIAHGVNYFDTAPGYVRGLSETATGIALKRHSRDKFFIATKLSNMGNNPEVRTFSGSRSMYDKSFRDLQVDYIDYYLLHNIGGGGVPTVLDRFYKNGMMDFLMKEQQAGRIRNLGYSFHGDVAAYDYLLAEQDKGNVRWDFVMIQMNYIDWLYATGMNTPAEYLMGELVKRDIQAVVMEPLLGGRLARINARALMLMKALHPQDTAAKWALRYVGDHPNVLTTISGMTYMEHLQDNLRSMSPWEPLTDREKEILLEVTEIMRDPNYIQCTTCQYCMPCPYGLDIPKTFELYNQIVSDEKLLKSSNDNNYRKFRREFLIGYDRAVPKARQADFCNGCDKCRPACPQRLNIPDELLRVETYMENLRQKKDFGESTHTE